MKQTTQIMTLLAFLLLALVSTVLSTQKKGFCFCGAYYTCGDTNALSGASWWYNWHQTTRYENRHCNQSLHGEYIPMITWEQDVYTNQIPTNSKYILGFNEPNAMGAHHLTPEKAAGYWKHIEQRYPHSILIGPGLTSCDTHPEWCIGWYERFLKACPNCRVDKIAVHSYHCEPFKIMQSLEKISKHFGKPIWLTEFACDTSSNIDVNIRFIQTLVPLLERAPFIERYAYFCTRLAASDKNHYWNLLDMHNPKLSRLGQVYNTVH